MEFFDGNTLPKCSGEYLVILASNEASDECPNFYFPLCFSVLFGWGPFSDRIIAWAELPAIPTVINNLRKREKDWESIEEFKNKGCHKRKVKDED